MMFVQQPQRSLAPSSRYALSSRSARVTPCASKEFRESVSKFFENMAFEKWAPRSSRSWRLPPAKGSAWKSVDTEQEAADTRFIDSLNDRIRTADSVQSSFQASVDEEEGSVASMDDTDLAESLNRRLASNSGSSSSSGAEPPLTGSLLRQLVYAKYGKTYDLSIVRREIPGKTIVALNVMWTHLEQQSFPMSEADYVDKLDTIAFYLRSWGQEEVVRQSLLEPPKSKRGLPARPIIGNAVSIRLNLSAALIEEWFGR